MSPIFRPGRGPYALAIAMTGARIGERLLQIGAGTPAMFAALAGKVGLSGRAAAVAVDQAGATALENAAANGGVLAEVEIAAPGVLQYEHEAFDLIVIDSTTSPATTIAPWLTEALRILRAGGRMIVAERVPKGGLSGLLGGRAAASGPADTASRLLAEHGFRPVRVIAEREGWRFTEGMKPGR